MYYCDAHLLVQHIQIKLCAFIFNQRLPADTNNLNTHLNRLYDDEDTDNASHPIQLLQIDSKYYDIDDLSNLKLPNNKQYKYTAMHINIHSLPAKIDQLITLLSLLKQNNINLHFILLCETFLKDSNSSLYNIPGYTLECKNRKSLSRGGVAIYIKNGIKYNRCDEIGINIEGEFESIFVDVISRPKHVIVGEVYRVPNTSESKSVEYYKSIINKINNLKTHCMLGTDQNFDLLKLETHKNTADLFNSFITAGLIPGITLPTRITHSTSTLIDNIYTNLSDTMTTHSAVLTYDISDHLPVLILIGNITKPKNSPLTIKCRPTDDHTMQNTLTYLKNTNWDYLKHLPINDAWNSFHSKINEVIETLSPLKLITIPHTRVIKQPWMSTGLLQSSRTSNKLFKKAIGKPKTHKHYIEFINYRNHYNKLKRKMKHKHYTDLFNKYTNDIRQTWKLLKSLIGRENNKTSISERFKINNDITSDHLTIANSFCDYFSTVGKKFASSIPPPRKNSEAYLSKEKTLPNSIYLAPTDTEEIKSIIKSLKPKKSTGHDNISTLFICNNKIALCTPITILINKSLESGIVPDACKIAKVTPIYKSKDKELCTNYRPISLLPSTSKILEKIIHKRVYYFLQQQNILYHSQYGFRSKHSTNQAVCEFIANTLNAIDNKMTTIGVFLDLSKAFDTIDHQILLRKLKYYGIRGLALEWFKNYLCNRKQFVNYNGTSSSLRDITCGVPQGSVLGPLLFIIYTNDLPNALSYSKCILFADDTTIYLSLKNIHELYDKINYDLETVSDWFRANKLTLNINKTNYMIFTKSINTHRQSKIIKLGPESINRVPHVKFLGIIIDEHLDWHRHIDHCKCKISSGMYALSSLKNTLGSKQLKMLYYSLIHPYLTYGIVLWGAANKKHINKLRILQNKSVRKINKSKYNDSAAPIYASLNIPNIQTIYEVELSKLMYQHVHSTLPSPLQQLFTFNSHTYDYNTRHKNDPHITQRRTELVSKSFLHKAPQLWLSIPSNIKQSHTMESFKYNIRKHLNPS